MDTNETLEEHEAFEDRRRQWYSVDSVTVRLKDPSLSKEEILEIIEDADKGMDMLMEGMDYEKFRTFLTVMMSAVGFHEVDYNFVEELRTAKDVVDGNSYKEIVSQKAFSNLIRDLFLVSRLKLCRALSH